MNLREKLSIILIFIIYLYVSTSEYNALLQEEQNVQTVESVVPVEAIIPKEKEISRSITSKQRVIHAKVTAYSPHDNPNGINADSTPNTTSTMTYPHKGVVAVDPKKISYGTQMYIPNYGYAIAEDTGYAVRKYQGIQIDIVMDTYEEAMAWGTQYIDVIIKE